MLTSGAAETRRGEMRKVGCGFQKKRPSLWMQSMAATVLIGLDRGFDDLLNLVSQRRTGSSHLGIQPDFAPAELDRSWRPICEIVARKAIELRSSRDFGASCRGAAGGTVPKRPAE